MAVGAVPDVDLPELPHTPLPDRVVSAFEELVDWQEMDRSAKEVWRQQSNFVLRRRDDEEVTPETATSATTTPAPAVTYITITNADSPYTPTADIQFIFCDCTAGAITVNLPAGASSGGRPFTIKKVDASANTVTVDGDGAETIDNTTTRIISSFLTAMAIVGDGTNWYIV